MSRREYQDKYIQYESIHIITANTSNSTWLQAAYNNGSRYFGLFLVGGGGAGTGDLATADHCGVGGSGGCVRWYNNIYITNNKWQIDFTIGQGGVGGKRNQTANSGEKSLVEYNNMEFVAPGGYGGWLNMNKTATYQNGKYSRLQGMAMPGHGHWWGNSKETCDAAVARYYSYTFDNKYTNSSGSEYRWTIKGEDGLLNPFTNDGVYYGGAGGSGYDAYRGSDLSSTYPNTGGKGGGGRGGYGANNAATNNGGNATFYGGGGGGAAFSSNHTNSLGGNGYQGIAILYIYNSLYNEVYQ